MKGLMDDASEAEHQEYGAWAECVLSMVRVTWRALMEECLHEIIKNYRLKNGPWTLRTPSKIDFDGGKHRWLTQQIILVFCFLLTIGMMVGSLLWKPGSDITYGCYLVRIANIGASDGANTGGS